MHGYYTVCICSPTLALIFIRLHVCIIITFVIAGFLRVLSADGQPMYSVSSDGQPMYSVSAGGQPLYSVSADGQSMYSVSSDGRPMYSVC